MVSADADDALVGDELAMLRAHVDICVECAAYQADVSSLARVTRVRGATVDPAFVATVLDRTQPARLGRGGWLRPALAWCGLLLAWQSLAPLAFGELDGTPTHIARHVGASTFALAVGLLYVAWRPHRAAGLLPLVAALLAAMLLGAAFDVLAGDRTPMAESLHVVELSGLVLLWMVAGSPGWYRVERLLRFRRAGVAPSTS